MSAAQSVQMSEVTRRLEVLEGLVTRLHSQEVDNKLETILTTVKEGAEGLKEGEGEHKEVAGEHKEGAKM